jgi:LPS-assembly protein
MLALSLGSDSRAFIAHSPLVNTFIFFCHGIFFHIPLYLTLVTCLTGIELAHAQQINPTNMGVMTPPSATAAAPVNRRVKIIRPNAPRPDEVIVRAVRQEVEGNLRRLRGKVEIETLESLLTADEVDYNEETGEAQARGSVFYKNYDGGDELRCDRADYDVKTESGTFWNVAGTAPFEPDPRPGVLTSTNPFVFEGEWAERLGDKYVLHNGFVTSCKLPKPWWTLRGKTFDIVPGSRAIARNARFQLRGVPLFYSPYFYKSLEKQPRRSGFLMPNIGNSNRRGFILGLGYYWAINRSYDLTYRPQYFSTRGFAHLVDFRGKPTQKSDFNFVLYGVNDKGRVLPDGVTRVKEGGVSISFTGIAELPKGWQGQAWVNYLSSFRFRQGFTETFNEAIFSEVNSVAYATKAWDGYSVTALFERSENFQSVTDDNDKISIRKLPLVEFLSQDRQVKRNWPLWWSFESSGALLRRNQLLYQTRQHMERFDASPRLMGDFGAGLVRFVPSVAVRSTYWGSSFSAPNQVGGQGLVRNSIDADAQVLLPSFARVYQAKGWLGEKLKHVVETRASFRYVNGVDDFRKTIRFDDLELLNDTSEAGVTIANRFFTKKKGITREWASWELSQRRFFDPDFGGSLADGGRNVNRSTALTTGFNFLDRPRNYSPVTSRFRIEPTAGLGITWMADYDPLRGGVTNSSASADGRLGQFFLSAGHNQVRSNQVLSPPANQFRGLIGLGQENQRGWNTALFTLYDYRLGRLQFMNTQVTYNTDCCGFSVQWRRLNFGTRFENQFRYALAISNVGSFGTLRRLERFF